MRAFTAALESMEKPRFSIGIIKPTPGLVDQYFNASTGENDTGENGRAGTGKKEAPSGEPWTHESGLQLVDSEVEGGKGLDTTPYDPQPGTEVTSKKDSTPVGEDIGESKVKTPGKKLKAS